MTTTTTTTTLTELQTLILTTASAREDGSVFPLSDAAERKRQTSTLQSLINRTLVERSPVTTDEQSWKVENGQAIGLSLTQAGRDAADIGSSEQAVAEPLPNSTTSDAGAESTAETRTVPPRRRQGTKQALVLKLLGRSEGATLADLVSTTGWLPHTTRAALTGLRNKGYAIDSVKDDGVRTYCMTAAS